MNLSVFIEATETGFRGTTGGPLFLAVEAASEQAVLDELKAQIAAKLAAGRIMELPLDGVTRSFGPDPVRFQAAWDRFANDPHLDEYEQAVAEARREREAAEEATAQAHGG